jgi:hypothetical protein
VDKTRFTQEEIVCLRKQAMKGKGFTQDETNEDRRSDLIMMLSLLALGFLLHALSHTLMSITNGFGY